jgi:hypothetical protein
MQTMKLEPHLLYFQGLLEYLFTPEIPLSLPLCSHSQLLNLSGDFIEPAFVLFELFVMMCKFIAEGEQEFQ